MRIGPYILILAISLETMIAQNGLQGEVVQNLAKAQTYPGGATAMNMVEPPPHPVRSMAEWEELQALAISWQDYPSILTEIVRHASLEVKVVIFCDNQNIQQIAQTTLANAGVSLANVEFVIAPNNSAWIRDYGPVSVYANDVEDLYFIDWTYNRQDRIDDEIIPNPAGSYFGVPVYASTLAPNRFVNIGGNFLTDGLGTAFASKLVLMENEAGNPFGAGPYSEAEIDQLMEAYNGIERYIKLDTLLHDKIHHLDMHMKFLDERTLLVGEYPTGLGDWFQIEANLQYVLDNVESALGSEYKVVRLLQPPDFGYIYPPAGDYRSYTNSVFVNKTILVPGYQEEFDTIALRVYRSQFPGYKVVLINCNQMIGDYGALHCITKGIGAKDPLWIAHPCRDDVHNNNDLIAGYEVKATIKHRTGVDKANVHYRTDTLAAYQIVAMEPTNGNLNEWAATLPHQPNGSQIYYYISAVANSGKEQVRPLTAPEGHCRFLVDQSTASKILDRDLNFEVFPNPATNSIIVSTKGETVGMAQIVITNMLGNIVQVLFTGDIYAGEWTHAIAINSLAPGTYFVNLLAEGSVISRRILVF